MSKFLKDPPRSTLTREPRQYAGPTKPEPVEEAPPSKEGNPNRTAWIVLLIIAIIVVIILVALLIWALASKNNTSNQPKCDTTPLVPMNVVATYNQAQNSATLTWTSENIANNPNNATSFNLFRGSANVSKTNFSQKVVFSAFDSNGNLVPLVFTFTNLPTGSNYFVITGNNQCGESNNSTAVSTTSCVNTPTTPPAPSVVQDSDQCGTMNPVEFIEINFPDANLFGGGYIIEGTGQLGTVDNYFSLLPQNSFGSVSGITQKCGGIVSKHNVTKISKWGEATLTSALPAITSTSHTITWNSLVGAEQYAVWFVAAGASNFYFFGGYSEGNTTSLTLPTTAGLSGFYAIVVGFKLCDCSAPSANTTHVSPV